MSTYRTTALISDAQARRIASDWHGGQGSALHTLSTTGAITDSLLREIALEIIQAESDDISRDLRALEKYVRSRSRAGAVGRVPGWAALWSDRPVKADQC